MSTPTLHLNGPGLNVHAWPGATRTVTFTYTDENDDPITGSTIIVVVGGDNSAVGPVPDEGDGITYFTATEGDPGSYVASITYDDLGSHRMRVVIDDEPQIVGRLLVTSSDESSPTLTVPLQLTEGGTVAITLNGSAGGGGGGVSLGETSTTAYRGDRGKIAYDHSQLTSGNPHDVTAAQVGADPTGTASGAVSAHAGAVDPHGDRAYTDAELAALTPGDIGAATAAQGSLADSAVQPGDLSTVATTGAYGDLSGTPTLGTAAAQDVDDFATGAEGDLAASAVQPGDLGAAATSNDYGDLDNLPTLGTAAAADVGDFATAAQGALADTATQPGDLSTVATTGAYSDLSGLPTLGTAAAEDVGAFDAAGTGAAEAADAISYAAHVGSQGLAQKRSSAWWNSYLSRATSAVDIVLVGDSITHQDAGTTTTNGWGMHLPALLNGKPINFVQPAGWRQAHIITLNPGATTQEGTWTTAVPSGYGVTMTNGQKATYVVSGVTDGISLVYSTAPGNGDLIVRNGVGGTVLATIDTDDTANDGRVWTSGALSSAARTYEIESVGNTKWAGVYLHDGTRTAGVRAWVSGRSGWTTADVDTQQTLDLITTLTPELVVLSTGTNDSDANYEARMRSLVANVQGVHAGPIAIVTPYVSSNSTVAKAAAARSIAADEDLILIDHARLLGDKSISSSPWAGIGVHPSGEGLMGLAHYAASILRGDPLSERLRQTPPTSKILVGGHSTSSTTITPAEIAMASGGATAGFTPNGFNFYGDTYIARMSAGGLVGIGSALSMFLNSPDGVIWAGHRQVVNAQTGTAYTVATADISKTIIRNNAGASTQDWPQDSAATLPIGTILRTYNRGAGAITHQAGAGATVLVTGTQGQHTWWTAQKIAANTWAIGPG